MNKKGNILLVAKYESDVGYAWWLMENFWCVIAKYYSEFGIESYLIYPKVNRIPEIILKAPITIIEHDFSDRSPKNKNILKGIIQKNKITNVYLTDRNIYDIYYFTLRRWGIHNIINHYHWAIQTTNTSELKKIKNKIIQIFKMLTCNYYISVSKYVMNNLINIFCIPSNKCCYILNGIEPICDERSVKEIVTREFNIPQNAIIIATVGRASFYKGYDILLKCANVLINDMKENNVYFLHIGDGPDLQQFKELAKKYNLGEKFYFAGKRNDVRKVLPSCHVGIQVSKAEGLSLAILEYMSAGLATLAPRNSGNIEVIEHGINGLLFKEGNYEEISSLIKNLCVNEEYRKYLGDNARRSVAEKFNIKRTNAELLGILKEHF